MWTARKMGKAAFAFLGGAMLILSIADVPAKLAIWSQWFKSLSPYLRTFPTRGALGCAGIFVCLAPWVFDWAKSWQIVPRKSNLEISEIAPEKRDLNLELIPHGENSSEVYLEVINKSETTKMSAQIRVLSKSYGDGVKKYGYEGFWSGPIFAIQGWDKVLPVRDHGERTSVVIPSEKSHLLRIASVDLNHDHGQCTLSLVGIEEKLMLDFEPTPNSHLPFFVLNVKFFGEGFVNTISRDYKVGPKTFRGPMEMTEVTA
jgi:hypothetical protein